MQYSQSSRNPIFNFGMVTGQQAISIIFAYSSPAENTVIDYEYWVCE